MPDQTTPTAPVGARDVIASAINEWCWPDECVIDDMPWAESMANLVLVALRAKGLVIVPQEAVDQPFQIGDEVFRPMGMGDWEDGIVTDVRHHWEVRVKYETLREGWINANEIHKPNRAALKEQGHG